MHHMNEILKNRIQTKTYRIKWDGIPGGFILIFGKTNTYNIVKFKNKIKRKEK